MKLKQFTSAIVPALLMSIVIACAESRTPPLLNDGIAYASDTDADGSSSINLTNNPAHDWIVAWSPQERYFTN